MTGTDCTAPIVFDDQWADGYRLLCEDHVYVLLVDLTNPAVRVDVAAASEGNWPIDSYRDHNTIAIINGDYQFSPCYGPGEICSQGLTISNGSDPAQHTNLVHLCTDGLIRREIGFSPEGLPVVDWWYRFVSDAQAHAWCPNLQETGGGAEEYSFNLVGAGPQFGFDGAFRWDCLYGYAGEEGASDCLSNGGEVVINDEHFGTSAEHWWNRYQSVVGVSADVDTLALGESYPAATMLSMHDVLAQRLAAYGEALGDAFKFDGGSVAGIYYYNHDYSITPELRVPNVLRVQRTHWDCYAITVTVRPEAAGVVGVSPPPNCDRATKYEEGTVVKLTAAPAEGYEFQVWSGDIDGSAHSTSFTVSEEITATANFGPSEPWNQIYFPIMGGDPSGLYNAGFENGPAGWESYSQNGWGSILPDDQLFIAPHEGSWAAWLGADDDEVAHLEQGVVVPEEAPYLTYWHWIDSVDYCGYDFTRVVANESVLETYDLCRMTNTDGWTEHSVDLTDYAGQSISLRLEVETDGSLQSDLYVDDLSFQASASLAPTVPTPPKIIQHYLKP